MTTSNFASMTSTELRKQASVLGIANYTKYKKPELLTIIIDMTTPKTAPIIEIKPELPLLMAPVKEKKSRQHDLDCPKDGTQAKQVYDMFKAHKGQDKWTVYRVSQECGASLNNTRRVFKRWFEADWNKK